MLKIMKECGTKATQRLAEVMASSIVPSANIPERNVLEEQSES